MNGTHPASRVAAGLVLAVGLVAATPLATTAHSDIRPTPDTIWFAWDPDPLFALMLLAGVWAYLRGVAHLWNSAGTGRVVRHWQFGAFLAGIGVLAIARLSPLDALGGALFSGHMVQHLALFLVAPMLVVLGRPEVALLWALPVEWRRRVSRWPTSNAVVAALWHGITHWVTVLILYGVVMWLWHIPALYDAALESQLVHDLEHASFAAVALLFWHRVLVTGRSGGMGHASAFLLVFATALHSSALGALLTFAPEPIYVSHEPYTSVWGLSPLEDQQLAGVLMWVPMGLWFTLTALVLISRWIAASGERVRQMERAGSAAEVRPASAVSPGRS